MLKKYYANHQWAVTLMELLVVVLIISILATIATGVYTGEARRARVAATQDLIKQLEIGIARYEVDTGSLPPSGSGAQLPPSEMTTGSSRLNGSGYLFIALTKSLSGNSMKPLSPLWDGPYIQFQAKQLKSQVSNVPGRIDIVDAWGNPILYVNANDYTKSGGGFNGGTRLFTGTLPAGANTDLPAPNPFAALGETYYNTSTYQLVSLGPDGQSGSIVNVLSFSYSFVGTDADDITNFGF